MEIGSKIHDKLISDFKGLKFSNNATIFTNVKKFYVDTMTANDCLIIPDSIPEETTGASAGNTATTRAYTFRAVAMEIIESSDTDENGDIKYSRLLNIQDSILDYLQKEPSNLNSWGTSNNVNIYKIRVNSVNFDIQQFSSGYGVFLKVNFSVYLNVIPQNL